MFPSVSVEFIIVRLPGTSTSCACADTEISTPNSPNIIFFMIFPSLSSSCGKHRQKAISISSLSASLQLQHFQFHGLLGLLGRRQSFFSHLLCNSSGLSV